MDFALHIAQHDVGLRVLANGVYLHGQARIADAAANQRGVEYQRFHKTVVGPAQHAVVCRGFPTDLQAQIMAVACVCQGTSVITENVFENRFKHATELVRMGARITIRDRVAVVCGVEQLHGAHVGAKDLRGGAALVIAGLAAYGTTLVDGEIYIDRGYEDLAGELNALGAQIQRVE